MNHLRFVFKVVARTEKCIFLRLLMRVSRIDRTGESEHAAIFTTATTFDAPRNVFVVNIQEPLFEKMRGRCFRFLSEHSGTRLEVGKIAALLREMFLVNTHMHGEVVFLRRNA